MNRPGPNHPTNQKQLQQERSWEFATYSGHELAQLRRMASLTPAEKVGWLESAQQVVESMAKAGKRLRLIPTPVAKRDSVGD